MHTYAVLMFMVSYWDGVDCSHIECMTHGSCATQFSTRCKGSKVIFLLVQEGLPHHYRLYNRLVRRLVCSASVLQTMVSHEGNLLHGANN